MERFKSWGTSFSVWSNSLKYCRCRGWLPTEFTVNHMHLPCLSLGKQLSPEETSYAQVCTNKPTHQACFTRQKSTPKRRWGDQTVGFSTRRPEKATCRCCGKTGHLHYSLSTITHLVGVSQFAFIQNVCLGQCHWFCASDLWSTWHTFGQHEEVKNKVHPFMKRASEKDHRRSGGSQLLEPITDMSSPHDIASEAEVPHLLQGWHLLQCMTKTRTWHHFASAIPQSFCHILNKLLTSVQIQLTERKRKTQTALQTHRSRWWINAVCLILHGNWACINHNFSIFY